MLLSIIRSTARMMVAQAKAKQRKPNAIATGLHLNFLQPDDPQYRWLTILAKQTHAEEFRRREAEQKANTRGPPGASAA
ncbi:MAG: hypothetical protein AAF958_15790 [Planctomycetota bacterium]